MENFLNTITKTANTYTGTIGLGGLSTGIIVGIFVIIAVFLAGITFGRSRVLIGVLSLYAARVIASGFLYTAKIETLLPHIASGWIRIGILIGLGIIVLWLLQRSAVGERLVLSEISLLSISIVTLASIGFLASLVINDLPQTILVAAPKNILPYFASPAAQFYWSIAPIVALVFIRRD